MFVLVLLERQSVKLYIKWLVTQAEGGLGSFYAEYGDWVSLLSCSTTLLCLSSLLCVRTSSSVASISNLSFGGV